MSGQSDWNPW